MLEVQADLRHQRTPAVRLTSRILAEAAKRKASDIHIEPRPFGAHVRLRIDGVLKEIMCVPANVQAALISRIKILADLDIADRRAAQDGRFLVKMGNSRLDLRVSTLPTNYGEKVVMRLLDPLATQVGFRELGLSEQAERMLRSALRQPQGMVLVTGPTGSGKSTTLYAALNVLRSPGVNIVTVEDPIEYHIDDINQVQVNPKAGLSFAACLRALLRQDPNVIMVGEIRDPETAETAVRAAQTGHLVLSSVHTNDALSTVARLTDLGLSRFQIASAMTLAIGQRLVRRFCECRVEGPPNSEEREAMALLGLPAAELIFRPGGCSKCDGSGYRGRIGIYEVLNFDEQIRACLLRSASAEEVRVLARAQGMSSLQEDALARLQAGLTSATEVFRAVPIERSAALICAECRNALAPVFMFCPYCGAAARRPESVIHASCA
jgi:type II secretory ATPase GspE/PulE/Tfp pilus assembly ATPase PilB-like protein